MCLELILLKLETYVSVWEALGDRKDLSVSLNLARKMLYSSYDLVYVTKKSFKSKLVLFYHFWRADYECVSLKVNQRREKKWLI